MKVIIKFSIHRVKSFEVWLWIVTRTAFLFSLISCEDPYGFMSANPQCFGLNAFSFSLSPSGRACLRTALISSLQPEDTPGACPAFRLRLTPDVITWVESTRLFAASHSLSNLRSPHRPRSLTASTATLFTCRRVRSAEWRTHHRHTRLIIPDHISGFTEEPW